MRKSLSVVVVSAALVLAGRAWGASVPLRLNEQGRLFQSGGDTPVTGNVAMVFTIYDAATAGTALWTETYSVTLDEGYFSVQLGSTVPFPATLWNGAIRYTAAKIAPGSIGITTQFSYSTPVTVTAFGYGDAYAACPVGTTMLSGGCTYNDNGNQNIFLAGDGPYDTATWWCEYIEIYGYSTSIAYAYALCGTVTQ
jgi:hypothetical protein